MTDDRDKSSRGKDSHARPTARDVPLVRGVVESEPAPRGQRPGQLPRDPTYEKELAQVELAVMRDRGRREDPPTKQGGGRRERELVAGQPPESITPESPGARAARSDQADARGPAPPSSGGRSVASGTLLSVGAVDPRGKTERTLETPRMFFSQPDDNGEAYFKPGKIPAVTVHQTLETETVKLSDSVDPRRAKTLPRIDRAALARLADLSGEPESEAPVAVSQPDSNFDDLAASTAPPPWNRQNYDPASSLGELEHDGQIHATLSPFREQSEASEPSFSLDGAPTRPEPYVARRASEAPALPSRPEPSAVPTQRDLPQHRIEASRPPPAPVAEPPLARARQPRAQSDSVAPLSEGVSPTTASIAAEPLERRAPWSGYAAFAVALLFAVAVGLWLTSGTQPQQASPDGAKSVVVPVKVGEPSGPARVPAPPIPTPTPNVEAIVVPDDLPAAPAVAPAPPPRKAGASSSVRSDAVPLPVAAPLPPAAPALPKSTPPKPTHETIF